MKVGNQLHAVQKIVSKADWRYQTDCMQCSKKWADPRWEKFKKTVSNWVAKNTCKIATNK